MCERFSLKPQAPHNLVYVQESYKCGVTVGADTTRPHCMLHKQCCQAKWQRVAVRQLPNDNRVKMVKYLQPKKEWKLGQLLNTNVSAVAIAQFLRQTPLSRPLATALDGNCASNTCHSIIQTNLSW